MVTESKITVRYAETDKMGIVHHSVYAVWFEVGRTDFIRQAGMPYSVMEQKGIMTPLSSLTCQFYLPAYYEDELIVKTSVSKITAARIIFCNKIKRQKDQALLATGSTSHGFVSAKTFRPVNGKKALPEIYQALSSAIEK